MAQIFAEWFSLSLFVSLSAVQVSKKGRDRQCVVRWRTARPFNNQQDTNGDVTSEGTPNIWRDGRTGEFSLNFYDVNNSREVRIAHDYTERLVNAKDITKYHSISKVGDSG